MRTQHGSAPHSRRESELTHGGEGTAGKIGQAVNAVNEAIQNPMAVMRRMSGEMDRLFGSFGVLRPTEFGRAWAPDLEVVERNGSLVVRADLPGLTAEDVKVRLEGNLLTIEGERRHEQARQRGGLSYTERSYGSFSRSLEIPEGVHPDEIQANFHNGVLEVSVPKTGSPGHARTIPVKAEPSGPDPRVSEARGSASESSAPESGDKVL